MIWKKRRRASNAVAVLFLLAVACSVEGCLWAPDLVKIRKDIQRQLPEARFEKKIELTLGPLSMILVRQVTKWVPDAREAYDYLRDLSRIELAIYETERKPSTMTVSLPGKLQNLLEREEWELALKVSSDNELVWLLYRIDRNTIREAYLVVMNDDELIMVKTEGRLERLIARALSESGVWNDPGNESGEDSG